MEINNNLFDLSQEQIETSKMLYSGKIIKCLISPYHTYEQLEKQIPFTKTTYLFPEREVPIPKLKGLISMIVNSPIQEEFRIITTNQNINENNIETMYIDYHKPFVSRIWFKHENLRVFLHKIEPCSDSMESLYPTSQME